MPSPAALLAGTVGRLTGTRSRAAGASSGATQRRADAVGPAATEGLRNERTRIVGTRTGLGADLLIVVVRLWQAISRRTLAVARQVSAVVNPLGWSMLGLVVVAFIVGYAAGWAELAAIAWAGAVIIVVASFFLIGGNAQRIELTMAHTRVVVGERAVGGIVATNPTRRRLLGTTLEIPVGRGLLEFPLPSIGPGAAYDDVFTVPTTRRGLITIGPVRSVRADPIGLVRREHVWPGSIELYVHPETVSIPSTSTGFVRDLEGQATRDLTSSDVAFNALRDYQLGDDRRWIHWKSTAKTGVYMVKQFEETRRSHLMVALSLATDDYADEEQFELAVSVAGSLGVRAIRDARTVSVVVSERTPEFAKRKTFAVRALSTITRTRLLDELALVERATAALGVVDMARVAAEQVAGTSVAFVVLGSTASPAQLRAVSSAFPSGVQVIAVLCDPGYTPSLRRVGELTVLTIGYLEDLQKSLARSQAA